MEARDFNDPRYVKWRKCVYARDRYKCRMPGCPGLSRKLNAHHIKRWAEYPTLRFVVSNGITLCEHCHNQVKDREAQYEITFQSLVANRPGPGPITSDAMMKVLLMKYAPEAKD